MDSHYPPGYLPEADSTTTNNDDTSSGIPGWQEALNTLKQHWEPMSPHWEELRKRLWISLLSWLAGTALVWTFQGWLLNHIQGLAPNGQLFIQLYPGELLWVSVKLALIVGVVLASPIIGYQVLRFTLPGLTKKEARVSLVLSCLAGLLLLGGLAFAWWVLVPATLQFLLSYGNQLAPYQLSVSRYVDFVLLVLLLTSVACLLPLGLWLLAFLGILSSSQLLRQWKVGLVALFLLSAVLTPSQDPWTMAILALLLCGLAGLSLLVLKLLRL